MLLIFVLGFFIEWIEISYIAVPLFLPVFVAARRRHGVAGDADLREPADLVPDAAVRLGAVLPARRGAAGDHDLRHLRGIIPFVALQVLALVLVFFFPGIATWLPKAIGW